MSIREEQCNKVCRILDDVLANRPTERDSLIVAVRKAFEALELFGNSEQLPSAQPDPLIYIVDELLYDVEKVAVNKDRHEGSMRMMDEKAHNALAGWQSWIGDYLRGEQE